MENLIDQANMKLAAISVVRKSLTEHQREYKELLNKILSTAQPASSTESTAPTPASSPVAKSKTKGKVKAKKQQSDEENKNYALTFD